LPSSIEGPRAAPAPAGLFRLVWRQSLIYNQCWEDPALDREALRLTPQDRVMVITSAGCNAIDNALSGASVLAVDANPRQNHLLELKLAGIRGLDFDAFFELFGGGGSPRAAEMYRYALRSRLSRAARGFWDHEIALFDPSRARGGSFYYGGTAGFFALAVKRYIDHVARLRPAIDRLLSAAGIEEQRRIWHDDVAGRLLGRGLLGLIGSRGVMTLLGVPEPQRAMVCGQSGGFARFLRDCLTRVVSVALLRDNYFWAVYILGRYSRESCPEYLKRDQFRRLKTGLVDRIEIRTGTVTDALEPERQSVTAFVLLDHMDWLAERPTLLEEEWSRIFAAAAPGARAIFRSGGPDCLFLPEGVRDRLVFDPERSARLHALDRVGTYGSFHIARLAHA
jgi:S-adenosylmethionine-diacylglycerol 3-amino-3-carboxypropyl transferase